DDEQAVPRGEGEGVRVLGPDDDESTRPVARPVPRRGRRAVDDSEEFWGERATDFELEGDATWSASSQGLTESGSETESEPRSRRGKRAARRAKTATPPPESRRRPEPLPDASGPARLPHWTEPPTGEVPTIVSGEQPPADRVTRVLTGVAIAVVALIMLKLGTGPATFMVAVIVGAAAFELYEAFRRVGYHPATVIGLLGCVSIVGIAYSEGIDAFPLVAILVVAFTMLWYMLEVVKARPIVNIAITLF